jgi:2-polyprenyl-3-methyl-5-hydroxy-6-metoxy-1,4-benzoquinol methylase
MLENAAIRAKMEEGQPAPDAPELVRCNLCGADDTEELYRLPDCRFEIDDVEWRVVRCRVCQLTYVNPRPPESAIWKYYPSAYYQDRDRGSILARYEIQAQQLGALAPGRLLDIGCANGDWIQFMSARGWRVSGLEPSPNSQNPHGLDIRAGRLPGGASWEPGTFDVVTSWAVVEHLHNPRLVFEAAQRLLRPGGKLVIVVPNARSISSRYAYQEDVPRHLYMFSRRTLARYATESGLRLERVVHDPRLFGGTGRGVMRVQLFKLLGQTPRDYFRFMRLSRRQRFQRAPAVAGTTLALGAVERALLTIPVVRWLRLSGHIVAHFSRDP